MSDSTVVLVDQKLPVVVEFLKNGLGLRLRQIEPDYWMGRAGDMAFKVDEGDYDAEEGPWLVAISVVDVGDVVDEDYSGQRAFARRIYEALVRGTPWRLELLDEWFNLVEKRPALLTV
ncbi:MAG: hypothetical protein U0904_10445 [Candidatus Nanopelagicales bacterium]|nr:hypothetical protein [Candidatus Nanopelagicales bacterium]